MGKLSSLPLSEILSGSGLENTAKAVIAAGGQKTVRQVVSGRYPQLPVTEIDYLSGLVEDVLFAGKELSLLPPGQTLGLGSIPINPGLGGAGTTKPRFLFSTVVNRTNPVTGSRESLFVDVASALDLSPGQVSLAAEAQLQAWIGESPKLRKIIKQYPLNISTDIIAAQRAW